MPIYEYECEACHKVSEVLQKISDPQPTTCTHCQGGPLKKLLSPTSFVLKGGGWYKDAYSSSTPKTASTPNTDGASASPSSSSSSSTSTSSPPPAQEAATPAKSTDTPKSEHSCSTGCKH